MIVNIYQTTKYLYSIYYFRMSLRCKLHNGVMQKKNTRHAGKIEGIEGEWGGVVWWWGDRPFG